MALNTLPQVAEALTELGYAAHSTPDAVRVAVGGPDAPLPPGADADRREHTRLHMPSGPSRGRVRPAQVPLPWRWT